MPRLDRRVDALEEIYTPPRDRFVIRVVPMTWAGHAFQVSAYHLPNGLTVARNAAEAQATFEARVTAEAMAATSGLPIVFSINGDEVPT
jgi:hypothetical protein